MIADLKPYPAMKDSGLPWCPEVPEHWELNPNRAYLRQRKVLVGDRHKEYTLLSLTKRGVIVRDLTDNKGKFSADMGTSQEVRSGDLVMCLFDVPETPRTVGLSKHNGMITGAYTVFDLQDRQPARWLELFYLAMDDQKSLSPLYTGLRNTIQKPRFLGTKTPIPPPYEQVAIVRYLDHVDRRVRRLVRAKRKLIALLTEQKQAIIHRAVTRGLDPDVPLKDSGVEWLGEVPEHWEVQRGKYFFREVDERSSTGLEELLSVSHLTGVTPRSQKNITMFKAESYVGSKICKPGQIAINTMWAWMGPIGVSRHHGIVSPSYHTYEQKQPARFAEDYLDLLVRTDVYKTLYRINSTGITSSRMRLYPEEFLNIEFLCPPLEEQNALLDLIQVETQANNDTVTRAEREIELLNEYRTRLIADVVTGKLDVRDAAAALPDIDPLAKDDGEDDLDANLDLDTEELDEALEEVEA